MTPDNDTDMPQLDFKIVTIVADEDNQVRIEHHGVPPWQVIGMLRVATVLMENDIYDSHGEDDDDE